MFKNSITPKTIVSALILLFLISSADIHAQKAERVDLKQKKSFLKMFKGDVDLHIPTFSHLKAVADNDIASWEQQVFNGEDWVDNNRATYEYNSSRTTITKHLEFFDVDEWLDSGSLSMTHNSEGFPLEIISEFFDFNFIQKFYYSPTGRLDSLTFEEFSSEESYLERVVLNYITEDSIRVVNTYYDEDEGGYVTVEELYFLIKDGNFIEVYDEGDYIDRYIYYDITLDDYLKAFGDEFYFIEMLNDELYDEEIGFVPYMKISLLEDDGIVTAMLTEYYDEFEEMWYEETKNTYTYEDGNIVLDEEAYLNGDELEVAYRTQYTYGATVSVEEEMDKIPAFELLQNYPNPFNPTTQINYNIRNSGDVLLEVYNMIGNKVATLVQSRQGAGEHSVTFNAENLSSGIYYYRLSSAGQMDVRSMTLIK
ncbi:MAG: T9SS type A sorting domain-containing protein [Balneolaceae bacterium]